MNTCAFKLPGTERSARGFTLVEMAVALALLALVMSTIILGYVETCYRAQWSAYSLAAQGLGIQQLEQARSAVYDPFATPTVDEILQISTNPVGALMDLPVSGSNYLWATNYISVKMITNWLNPVVTVHMVRVDTVWPLSRNGTTVYFTNTVAGYYAPDY